MKPALVKSAPLAAVVGAEASVAAVAEVATAGAVVAAEAEVVDSVAAVAETAAIAVGAIDIDRFPLLRLHFKKNRKASRFVARGFLFG